MELFALALTNTLAAVGITVIVPILGIAGDIFGVDQGYSMWLMTGFMLAYASFMPILGRLSDMYGRKKIFVISTGIFAIGLLISSVSKNFNLVILGRVVQGLGAGGILPVANAMVVDTMRENSEKGLAVVNATYGLGMILGVNLGGILYDSLGWRSLFYIPLILVALSLVMSIFFLRETVAGEKKSVDYLGSALFASSMISLMLGLKNLASNPLSSPSVLGYLLTSAVLFAVFVFVELKTKNPALNLRAFKKPGYLIYNLIALFFGTSMFLLVTFMAPYAQVLLGYDISSSVYSVDPFALSMVVFIMIGGAMMKRFGSKSTMVLGSALLATFSIIFAEYTRDPASFYILSILLASGLGVSMTPMNHVVMEEGGKGSQGASAGIVSIMRSIGGMIGPTLAGIILARVDYTSIFAIDNLIEAYRNVFKIAFFSACVALLLSGLGLILGRTVKKEVAEI